MAGKNEPLVMFLDAYENLVNEFVPIGDAYTKDEWLKGESGLIQNTPKVLWVIAGREKLKWEVDWDDRLEQHLMENISEPDAVAYFNAAEIPESFHHGLYELTHRTPLLLDLTVDTYYRIQENGKEPTLDMFGNTPRTIVELYIRYMTTFQQKIMYKMAFLRRWPADDIRIFKYNDSSFDDIQFEVLAASSCIKEIANLKILHESVGEILRKACAPSLKRTLCVDLLSYFKEEIKTIESSDLDSAYLMTTTFAVALDYYTPKQVCDFYEKVLTVAIDASLEIAAFEEAIDVLKKTLEIFKKVYGSEASKTIKIMGQLESALLHAGRYLEGLDVNDKMLKAFKRKYKELPVRYKWRGSTESR